MVKTLRLHCTLPEDIAAFLEARKKELGANYSATIGLALRAYMAAVEARALNRADLAADADGALVAILRTAKSALAKA